MTERPTHPDFHVRSAEATPDGRVIYELCVIRGPVIRLTVAKAVSYPDELAPIVAHYMAHRPYQRRVP